MNIGKTPPRDDSRYWLNAKRNWVSISDMTNYGRIKTTKEQISEEAANSLMRESSPINTLLMSFKLTVGRTAILDIEAYHNEAIVSIYPYIDKEFILRNYLFYTLPILANIGDSKDAIKGKTLNSKSLNNLLIPLPPVNEQQRIVNKLEELIPHIEHYGKAQTELDLLNKNIKEQLKKSVLQYAIEGKLVPQDETEGTAEVLLEQIQKEKQKLYEENKLKKKDLEHSTIFKGEDNKYYEKIGKNVTCIDEEISFEIPNGWVWARMGQIGDWGAGSTPSRSNPNYYNGKILWLKTGELNNGIVFDTEEKITEKAFQECSLRINKVGNVLIAMYGATIGKLAIAGKELTTNQACCGCSPYLINNWYLFYFLMASREQFIKRGEGGAQPNISRVKLVEHLIPLPPLSEQQRIVNTIQNIFRCIEN